MKNTYDAFMMGNDLVVLFSYYKNPKRLNQYVARLVARLGGY